MEQCNEQLFYEFPSCDATLRTGDMETLAETLGSY